MQIEPFDVAIPVTAVSSQYANNIADFVVASFMENNETAYNYFAVEFVPLSLAEEFEEEAEVQCTEQIVVFESISQNHQAITRRVDEVVYKDFGNFTFSSNLTFLGGFDAADTVVNESKINQTP